MKTITHFLALAAAIGLASLTHAQNALSFDGMDDYGAAPNASALISGSTTLSLSMWVFPKSNSSGYPDFDGYGGFRNDATADFYLLQLGSNNLEARFRNSSGTDYTITYNGGMILNDWNHLVLVYDGSTLKLYHNGSLIQSISASGSISSSSVPFNVGYTPFAANNFYTYGDLDDVGLWDKALSATEVSSLYSACGMNVSDPNLVLCYEFNQGTANGNNTSIFTATDSKGNINANLSGFAMSGSSSNFIPGTSGNSSSSLNINTCHAYTSPSGHRYTSSGTYHDTIPNASGCDSIITISLTVDSVDVSVLRMGDTLMAAQMGAIYQWHNCNSGTNIIGAVNRTYIPPVSGSFAVIVTKGNCVDTSDCIAFTKGIGQVEERPLEALTLYPNPSNGTVKLLISPSAKNVHVEVINLAGQRVFHQMYPDGDISFDLDAPSGVYMVRVTMNAESKVFRLVLE
ncbi:LamG-like jellyroll fold domain-containing protein [Phaeocystidibacter marisrubri]|uniref:T9SS type A sorting domain-containing protein n=1 Tax=Phaeocystidibacter marisrubri TaxID=1577780 RepID=A0A6L3ZGG5_9FLAO|nr:LamG-like jellyroll fold domain-containing protein [Phaeocystidibacter marisrubri]KAB2816558.1 T9SS type A sorting domain-containing protein [Phaeocystidibacter marisrubri]GGH69662.1 hypothetical protein GCM10011318_10910 [Phaeocystidibacter marisrubri]